MCRDPSLSRHFNYPFVISYGGLSRGKAISATSRATVFSIAASLLIYPLGGSLMGQRVGLDLQKEPLSIHHAACSQASWIWQQLPPSSSALLSLRTVPPTQDNHTDWGSLFVLGDVPHSRTSISVKGEADSHLVAGRRPHRARLYAGGLRCRAGDWYRFQRKQVEGEAWYYCC